MHCYKGNPSNLLYYYVFVLFDSPKMGPIEWPKMEESSAFFLSCMEWAYETENPTP